MAHRRPGAGDLGDGLPRPIRRVRPMRRHLRARPPGVVAVLRPPARHAPRHWRDRVSGRGGLVLRLQLRRGGVDSGGRRCEEAGGDRRGCAGGAGERGGRRGGRGAERGVGIERVVGPPSAAGGRVDSRRGRRGIATGVVAAVATVWTS